MKPNSQCARILRYLQSGKSLTPAQAYRLFGTLALHSRIAELRDPRNCWFDYPQRIETRMVKLNGKRVGEYSIA